MNVFISWSGDRSHAVAQLLQTWVSDVIQAAKPWLSSADIERGATWMVDINAQLQSSTVGIFCLTGENKAAPWILFEAGAVAKGVETSRICTLLIDIEPTDVTGPLAQFNHTKPGLQSDMVKLARTLNKALGPASLSEEALKRSFDAHWEKFAADFAHILVTHQAITAPPAPRAADDVLSEILETVRAMGKRIGAVETLVRSTASRVPSSWVPDERRGTVSLKSFLDPSTLQGADHDEMRGASFVHSSAATRIGEISERGLVPPRNPNERDS